jgi:predicted metalloprotease with PDZ domain
MTSRSISITAAVLLLAVFSVRAEEAPKCSATAKECEREIRQMLSGRRYLGVQIIDTKPGIVIKAVNDDGPAAQVDLQAGDRILAVNGRSMSQSNVKEFKGIIGDVSDTGGLLFMIILRHGSKKVVEVRLQPYPKAQVDKIVAAHLALSHAGEGQR